MIQADITGVTFSVSFPGHAMGLKARKRDRAEEGDRKSVGRGCDVCDNFRPSANRVPNRRITPVSFGDHTVMLCEAHRRIALSSGVTTFEDLRDFYGESSGRRSYVPRRTRTDGTHPEAERRSRGRRSTDR